MGEDGFEVAIRERERREWGIERGAGRERGRERSLKRSSKESSDWTGFLGSGKRRLPEHTREWVGL